MSPASKGQTRVDPTEFVVELTLAKGGFRLFAQGVSQLENAVLALLNLRTWNNTSFGAARWQRQTGFFSSH